VLKKEKEQIGQMPACHGENSGLTSIQLKKDRERYSYIFLLIVSLCKMTRDKVKLMNRKGSCVAELHYSDVYLCFHKIRE